MSRETNYIYFVGRTDYNRMFYFEAIKNFQLNQACLGNNAIAVRTRRSWHMYDNHDWENLKRIDRPCTAMRVRVLESGMRSGESTPRYVYSKETCEGLETPATWITNSSSRNMQILIIEHRSFICDRNKKMIFWLMIFISCHFFLSQVRHSSAS